jgi:hypothetical protein
MAPWVRKTSPTERPMAKFDDLSRSLVALDQDSTLIAVIELSRSSWLVGGIIPGVDREPLKKLTSDGDGLLRLLHRWRDDAAAKGHAVARICVAYEAGRDGVLAGALAAGARHRMPGHRPDQRVGVARAPASQERPARCWSAEAFLSGMAAGREEALQHGGGADGRGGVRQAAVARARAAGRRGPPAWSTA